TGFSFTSAPFTSNQVSSGCNVGTTFFTYATNIYAFAENVDSSISKIASFSITDGCSGNPIHINNTNDDIIITIKNENATWNNNTKIPQCRYFDTHNNIWSTKGCRVDTDHSTVAQTICLCNHLTDFNVHLDDFNPPVHFLTADDIGRLNF